MTSLPVSSAIHEAMQRASWIRRMFEEGARLKRELGEENVCDFSLGNPVMEPPERVREALVEAAGTRDPGAHRYMHNAGLVRTREAVAAHLAASTGLAFEWRHVVMSVGAGGGLNAAFKALLDADDEVLLLAPHFPDYPAYVGNHRGVPVRVPTDERFLPDPAAIEAAVTARTRLVVMNSPNNPTGVVYPREAIDAVGEVLRRASARIGRTIYLLTDEPYRHIVFGVDVPWVFASYRDTILVTSHSKDLALPGERIGHVAVSPEVDDVDLVVGAITFTTRALGYTNAPAIQQRAVASLQGFSVDAEVYRRKRDRLYDALTAMGYEMVRPEGAFYLFPRSPIEDDVAFVRELQEERLLAVPGTGFGRPGHFRIAYCVDDDTIERSLPAFERVARRHELRPQPR
jgi:aspartate aminotransferase